MLYHLFVNSLNDCLVSCEPHVENYTRVYSIRASSWDEAYYRMVTIQRDVFNPMEYSH